MHGCRINVRCHIAETDLVQRIIQLDLTDISYQREILVIYGQAYAFLLLGQRQSG
jgi:hypothetical protein